MSFQAKQAKTHMSPRGPDQYRTVCVLVPSIRKANSKCRKMPRQGWNGFRRLVPGRPRNPVPPSARPAATTDAKGHDRDDRPRWKRDGPARAQAERVSPTRTWSTAKPYPLLVCTQHKVCSSWARKPRSDQPRSGAGRDQGSPSSQEPRPYSCRRGHLRKAALTAHIIVARLRGPRRGKAWELATPRAPKTQVLHRSTQTA